MSNEVTSGLVKTKSKSVPAVLVENPITYKTVDDYVPPREKWVYYLPEKNQELNNTFDLKGHNIETQEYRPVTMVPNMGSINWPGGFDPFGFERGRGKYMIRYYEGCTNIFVDQQPSDPAILENLLRRDMEGLNFQAGRLEVSGFNTMKVLYLNFVSHNSDSPFRVPSVRILFRSLDTEKEKQAKIEKVAKKRQALVMAHDAPDDLVLMHAKFLGIALEDPDYGKKEADLLRVEYEEIASYDPDRFLKTYNDKTIKYKYYTDQAVMAGIISSNIITGWATWVGTAQKICEVPQGLSGTSLVEALVKFIEKEGESDQFRNELKAFFE